MHEMALSKFTECLLRSCCPKEGALSSGKKTCLKITLGLVVVFIFTSPVTAIASDTKADFGVKRYLILECH